MVHDAIRNYDVQSFSFVNILKDDFLYNHSFSDPVEVLDNNLVLYKIDFTGKSRIMNNSVSVSGSKYIQPRNFAIYKLEYTCYYIKRKEEPEEMFNIDIEYGHENILDSVMYLKYISFNNIFYVRNPTDNYYFRITDSYWDPDDQNGSRMIVEFNNNIDPGSAKIKDNYEIKVKDIRPDIRDIRTSGKLLYLTVSDKNLKELQDSTYIHIKNLKDTNGNILDQIKTLKLYQFRELFVQEYNRSINFTDSCYLQYFFGKK